MKPQKYSSNSNHFHISPSWKVKKWISRVSTANAVKKRDLKPQLNPRYSSSSVQFNFVTPWWWVSDRSLFSFTSNRIEHRSINIVIYEEIGILNRRRSSGGHAHTTLFVLFSHYGLDVACIKLGHMCTMLEPESPDLREISLPIGMNTSHAISGPQYCPFFDVIIVR